MRRHLGKLIWRQSRDITVLNYAHHTIFEIFTNQGTLRIIQDKHTQKLEVDPIPKPIPISKRDVLGESSQRMEYRADF